MNASLKRSISGGNTLKEISPAQNSKGFLGIYSLIGTIKMLCSVFESIADFLSVKLIKNVLGKIISNDRCKAQS